MLSRGFRPKLQKDEYRIDFVPLVEHPLLAESKEHSSNDLCHYAKDLYIVRINVTPQLSTKYTLTKRGTKNIIIRLESLKKNNVWIPVDEEEVPYQKQVA
jgi:hypothetical protein